MLFTVVDAQEAPSREDKAPNPQTLVVITGIKDPLCLGVREAVAACYHIDVTIKMRDILSAHSIATQRGTCTAGYIVMEDPSSALSIPTNVSNPQRGFQWVLTDNAT